MPLCTMRIGGVCLWHGYHSLYEIRLEQYGALRGVGVCRDEGGKGLEDDAHRRDVVLCHGHATCIISRRAGTRGSADTKVTEHVSLVRGDAGNGAGAVREVAECAVEDFRGGRARDGDETECDQRTHGRPCDEDHEDRGIGGLGGGERVERGEDVGEVLGLVG